MLFRELSAYYEKLEGISSRLSMVEILTDMFNRAKANEIANIIYITQGVLAPPFEGMEFGMAEKMVEEAIAIATGYTKEEVDREYKKQGDMGIAAGKLKSATKLRRMSSSEYTVNEVYESMRKMAAISGQGSKDTKIKMLANMMAASTSIEAKYIAKYPLDELRMGVGDATVLEALAAAYLGDRKQKQKLEQAYNLCSDLGLVGEEAAKGAKNIEAFKITVFKPIRPALAERLPTAEEIMEKMGGSCAVDEKYDGFRCQVHKNGSKVKIFSRRLEDTTHMYPDLVAAVLKEVKAEAVIIDSEALAYNEETNQFLPFQETIQRKRKHGIAEKIIEMPLKLFAFDIMYLNGKSCLDEPYSKRREMLEKLLKGSETILPSGSITARSAKELEKFFEKSIENGLEGIIAKDPNSKYTAGARKFAWIKMKRSYKGELEDTLDLVIVGYYLGRGSRSQFRFGGILCASYNEKRDLFETVSRIGSGFTEVQMVALRETLEKIKTKSKPARLDSVVAPDFWVQPKYVVTVRADEITKSPTHTCGREKLPDGSEVGYALRFPRLVGEETIRKDKGPEEATTTKEVIEMFKAQKRVGVGSTEA